MSTTTPERARLGLAAVIGLLVPIVAVAIAPSDELAIALCLAIAFAACLARIDFRVPLLPGLVLLTVSAMCEFVNASEAAREIATVGAAMVIIGVLLALSMQRQSHAVLSAWLKAAQSRVEKWAPGLLIAMALAVVVVVFGIVIAAFVLLNASLLATLVASVIVLTARSLGRSPTVALTVFGLIALVLSASATLVQAGGTRIDFGTMSFVFLFFASGFALADSLRSSKLREAS